MPPMTGRVVAGRYSLQHPIGRGAMGVVWRARDQLLDRDVAVKEVVISALIGADERRNAYQRTLREARTAARLSHRGVVAVYDVAEEDGRPWIIMELVPSRSLDQVLLVEKRLTPLRTGRIGQQLLSALAAAHTAGVLHRDVKPSNVLIGTDRGGNGWDERAVLTDFGIAQFEGDPRLTQTGMVMGSPGFTAPERIRGGDATPASDLWSLGATLYTAAEGRGPYEQRGGAITTMSAIINEDAPAAAHAGPLGPIIAALLRREPSARPSASAAARMFAQLLPMLAEFTARAPETAHSATVHAASLPAPVPTAPAEAAPAEPAEPAAVATAEPAVVTPPAAAAPADATSADATPAAEPAASAPAPELVPDPPEDQADGARAVAGPPEASAEAGGPAEPDALAAPDAEAEPDAKTASEFPADSAVTPASADSAASAEPEVEPQPQPEPEPEPEAAKPPREPEPVGQGATDAAGDPDANLRSAAAAAAVAAAEAEVPPDSVDADGSRHAGSSEAAADAPGSVLPQTVIDRGRGREHDREPAGHQPTELSIPAASPVPRPRFTASQRKETGSAAPTFSAWHQDQAGPADSQPAEPQPAWGSPTTPPAQHGPYQGTTTPVAGSAGQYAGPSQAHVGLVGQYTPGTGGGRAQRRGRPWRWIAVVIGAVILAVAIGAGAAYALGHHGAGTQAGKSGPTGSKTNGAGTVSAPLKSYASVTALNHPSAVIPAGWTPVRVTAAEAGSQAGFSIDLPPGWTEHRDGLATDFTSSADMVLEIDLTPHKYQNMLAEASYIARRAAPKFTGYQLLHLQAVPVRSVAGAIWQFKRTSAGVLLTADDIVFIEPTPAGSQSYAVYIRAPSNGWGGTYLPAFDKILPTFQTLPAS